MADGNRAERRTGILTSHPVITRVVLCALGGAPIILILHAVVTTWTAVPYWDEWSTPGQNLVSWSKGTLTFGELFSQHNENRKFFSRLLYLALAQIGGWDVRKEMTLLFLMVCAIPVLFYRLLRKTPAASITAAFLGCIAATFLCFSPVQLENFLWGIQLELFVPGLALLAMATTNLSRLSIGRKSVCNAAFALLATYTAAPGMLLWALGFPWRASGENWRNRQMLLSWGGYLVTAAIAIGAYFVGYERPAPHPELFAGGVDLLKLAHYVMLWVGSYFTSSLIHPAVAGGVAIALFLACLIGTALVLRRGRVWRSFYPALVLAAYASITAILITVARIGFGVEQAVASRYRPYSLFFYLAIVGLLFALYSSHFQHAPAGRRRVFLAGCWLAAGMSLAAWTACWADGKQERLAIRNRTFLHALQWRDVIPDNPDLAALYPRPDHLRETADILTERRILRLPVVSMELARRVSQPPPTLEGDPFGRLESCAFDAKGRLGLAGRVRGAAGKRAPTHVVLGALDPARRWKLFGVMPLRSGRKGPNDLVFSRAFTSAHLPAGDLTIAAWAIDSVNEETYPLGGMKISSP